MTQKLTTMGDRTAFINEQSIELCPQTRALFDTG